jgi:hypothetical protein
MNSEVLHFIEMVGGVSPYALPRPVKKPFSFKLSTLDKTFIVIGVIFLIVGLALLVKSAYSDREKLMNELDKIFKAEKKKMEDMADEITNLKKENLFTKNLLAKETDFNLNVKTVKTEKVAEVHEINGVKIEDIG